MDYMDVSPMPGEFPSNKEYNMDVDDTPSKKMSLPSSKSFKFTPMKKFGETLYPSLDKKSNEITPSQTRTINENSSQFTFRSPKNDSVLRNNLNSISIFKSPSDFNKTTSTATTNNSIFKSPNANSMFTFNVEQEMEQKGFSKKLSNSVLQELSNRAAKLSVSSTSSTRRTPTKGSGRRYSGIHRSRFNKMDSISAHYAAGRRRVLAPEMNDDNGVMKRNEIEQEQQQLRTPVHRNALSPDNKRVPSTVLSSVGKRRRTLRGAEEMMEMMNEEQKYENKENTAPITNPPQERKRSVFVKPEKTTRTTIPLKKREPIPLTREPQTSGMKRESSRSGLSVFLLNTTRRAEEHNQKKMTISKSNTSLKTSLQKQTPSTPYIPQPTLSSIQHQTTNVPAKSSNQPLPRSTTTRTLKHKSSIPTLTRSTTDKSLSKSKTERSLSSYLPEKKELPEKKDASKVPISRMFSIPHSKGMNNISLAHYQTTPAPPKPLSKNTFSSNVPMAVSTSTPFTQKRSISTSSGSISNLNRIVRERNSSLQVNPKPIWR